MIGEEIRDSLGHCNVDDDCLPELRQFKPLACRILKEVGELDPLAHGMSLLGL